MFVCKQGVLKNIASSSRDALGKIYSRITYLLGMKPWEHEYKVMGLAPYANSNYSDEIVKNVFKKLIYVDKKLTLKTKTKLSMNYCYKHLSSKLNRKRFDNISGAIQKFTEDILLEFVKSAIKKPKLKKLVFGGGVFMNVKANKLISKLKEIEDFFFMPSCGDDSLSFGAALHFYYQKTKSKNFKKSSINNLYLGNKYEIDEENKILNKYKLKSKNKFIIYKKNLNSIAAKLLKDGKVIGRCADRAEWGARALGNRSIIARPDNYLIVDKINEMVKKEISGCHLLLQY